MGSVQGALLVKDASCKKLLDMYDNNFAIMNQGKAAIVSQINTARSYINQIPAFTPKSQIDSAVNDVVNNYGNMIPAVDDFDSIIGIINQCMGLSDDDMLRTPTALVRGITGKVKDGIKSSIGTLTSGLPEFHLANQIQSLLDSIGTGKVDFLLNKLTKYLSCLDQFCGYNMSSRLYELQNFTNSCYVDPSGRFQLSTFLDSTTATAEAKLNMVTCVDTYENALVEGQSRVTQAVTRLKGSVPTPKLPEDYVLPTQISRYISL